MGVLTLYQGDTHERAANVGSGIPHWCVWPDPERTFLVEPGWRIITDSGAFPDVSRGRISIPDALERQLAFESRSGYVSEFLVSYDRLIDEIMKGGKQVKKRWPENLGWSAVEETVAAAKFLSSQRERLGPRRLILSSQGVTPDQYTACSCRVLSHCQPVDCFGFGGFCIIGQRRHLLKGFAETVRRVLPLVKEAGLSRVHLFGVGYTPALLFFEAECRALGLAASTDTNRFYKEVSRGYRFDPRTGSSPKVGRPPKAGRLRVSIENMQAAYEYIRQLPLRPTASQMDLFGLAA